MTDITIDGLEDWFKRYSHYELSDNAKDDLRDVYWSKLC